MKYHVQSPVTGDQLLAILAALNSGGRNYVSQRARERRVMGI